MGVRQHMQLTMLQGSQPHLWGAGGGPILLTCAWAAADADAPLAAGVGCGDGEGLAGVGLPAAVPAAGLAVTADAA